MGTPSSFFSSSRTTPQRRLPAWCSLLLLPPAIACSAAPIQSTRPAKPEANAADQTDQTDRAHLPEEARPQPGADPQAEAASDPASHEASHEATLKKSPSKLVTGRHILRDESPDGLREFVQELEAAGNDGNLWTGSLRGNGGRAALIYIPAGADPDADFRVVVHFHGTYSDHIEHHREGMKKRTWVGWDRLQQTIEGADALQAAGPENIALIYPFSAGKRMEPEWKGWSNKAYDRMWMRPEPPTYTDDFAVLLQESETILEKSFGVHPSRLPKRVTVEGHSAGGIALWNIARTDDGRVGDYLFLDAGFHLWADGCYAALTDHHTDARIVLVIRDRGIADPLDGPNAWCSTHPPLVDAWPEVAEQCKDAPKRRPTQAPGGGKVSCQEWAEIAKGWPAVAKWCVEMAHDMHDLDGVFVHRTKVVHGEQPRAFFGGMGIPEMQAGTSTKSPPEPSTKSPKRSKKSR